MLNLEGVDECLQAFDVYCDEDAYTLSLAVDSPPRVPVCCRLAGYR